MPTGPQLNQNFEIEKAQNEEMDRFVPVNTFSEFEKNMLDKLDTSTGDINLDDIRTIKFDNGTVGFERGKDNTPIARVDSIPIAQDFLQQFIGRQILEYENIVRASIETENDLDQIRIETVYEKLRNLPPLDRPDIENFEDTATQKTEILKKIDKIQDLQKNCNKKLKQKARKKYSETARRQKRIIKKMILNPMERELDFIENFTNNIDEDSELWPQKKKNLREQRLNLKKNYANLYNLQDILENPQENQNLERINHIIFTLNSPTDIRESEKFIKNRKKIRHHQAIENIILTQNIDLTIQDQNEQTLENYLKWVLAGRIDPQKTKFHPATGNQKITPLLTYLRINHTEISWAELSAETITGNQDRSSENASFPLTPENLKTDPADMDMSDAFQRHGIRGAIENALSSTNMDARTRKKVSGFLTLGAGAAAVWWVWKRLSQKNKDGKRNLLTKWLTIGGVWLWSLALLGESPVSAVWKILTGWYDKEEITKIQNNFSGIFSLERMEGFGDAEHKIFTKYPQNAALIFGSETTLSNLQELLNTSTMKFTDESYQNTMKLFNNEESDRHGILASIGPNDPNQQIKHGLEIMGITAEKINNGGKKTVEDFHTIYLENSTKFQNYLSEKKLEIDGEKYPTIRKFFKKNGGEIRKNTDEFYEPLRTEGALIEKNE